MAGRIDLKTIGKTLKKFRYPALILLLGLGLILWPSRPKQDAAPPQPEPVQTQSLETRMEEVLSCVDGAGQVRVLLTRRTGDETVYQSDESLSRNGDAETSTLTTVMARGAGGTDVPVERMTVYGAYRGALILCTGADSAQVRLDLIKAVSGLTGLSSDRITVIKMKHWEDAA